VGESPLDLLEGKTVLDIQIAQLVVDEGRCVHAWAAYGSDYGISEKNTDRACANLPCPQGITRINTGGLQFESIEDTIVAKAQCRPQDFICSGAISLASYGLSIFNLLFRSRSFSQSFRLPDSGLRS